tara:strand:+ start:19919 stop:21190 length:1272 start_codon:yes stop_codon:yes gene_type:complete
MSEMLQVPCLTTALTGPLQTLEKVFLDNQCEIETWLREQFRKTPAPIYGSVDLRNAGFKLAPVDTNLFPAGFNNLNPEFLPLCVQAAQQIVDSQLPGASKIVLVPENHTRNHFYLDSVAVLQQIFTMAGFDVRIGSMLADLTEAQTFELPSGKSIVLEPLQRDGDSVKLNDFVPDLVLLNNDLSGDQPVILQNLKQPIMPPLSLGWSTRLKSEHFSYYFNVAAEFCELFDIDPWLLTPLHRNCGKINYMEREGEDCLYANSTKLFAAMKEKYVQYGITEKPFIIVKADAGSYGMGIMTATSPDDLVNLNRKQRTKMSTTKGGEGVSRVILQEGVYTFETWGDEQSVAEPVVYMIGQHVVGGFYRVHGKRGVTENLNAPGAHFEPLAFMKPCNVPGEPCENRFYAYGVVARLALVAAARELAAS